MFKRNFQKNKEEKKQEFESKLLDLARTSHTRAGGRRIGFRAVIIIGDKNGRVGLGVAKGADVAQAIEKATKLAKKNLINVPIISDTISQLFRILFPMKLMQSLVQLEYF